jgi:hypothetical protein
VIRIPVSQTRLLELISAENRKWLDRARASQARVNAAGSVGQKDGIWSDIKGVYMALQGYKCMYCEKPLPKSDPVSVGATGKVEYDVEHFRPKNRVLPWPTDDVKEQRRITYDDHLNSGFTDGYVWLAFDPLNYGVSCKTCNSELKGDRFPIRGTAGTVGKSPAELDALEQPCLILPIGDQSDDPERFLSWAGPFPRPRAGLSSMDELRARVLVDFFELDTRLDLIGYRCQGISLLYPKLKADTPKSRLFVASLTAINAPFAGCFRAFARLHGEDRREAESWAEHCDDYIATRDLAALPIPS